MFEVIALFCLGLIWILIAIVEDFKTREITNWINYSLIIFGLGFRLFYSLFGSGDWGFFYQGLIGLGIFFVVGNLLYYGKMFAGGDYRLFLALGVILPFSYNFLENLQIFLLFILLFLFAGAAYGLVMTIYFAVKSSSKFRKEFVVQLKRNKIIVFLSLILACALLIFGFFQEGFFYLGLFFFILPYFYVFTKSVDESSMVRKVKVEKVTPGDWLYKDVKIGKKVIKYCWDGLSEKEVELLKKKKKFVYLRYGVQFAPAFLISFILLFLSLKFEWFNWLVF